MDDTTRSRGKPQPSGRFLLRISPDLHSELRGAARRAGLSLNDYCARKLAAPLNDVTGPATDVIRRAASVTAGKLVGAVAFGSWSRDELHEGSDVDVLLVVEADLPIERALYREWDTDPLVWDEGAVEPHFVHLPAEGARISGLWAEAAIDGVVLLDRDLEVSRRLVEIRGRIVDGEIVRKLAHGQPYWVGVA